MLYASHPPGKSLYDQQYRLKDGSENQLVPQSDPDNLINETVLGGLSKTTPSFHLLIPATQSNSNLCKTLLSSFVLGYPSPTLINYGKEFDVQNEWNNGTHNAKIRGVHEFLNDQKRVKDDDLVLIIDGDDIWFQLPPKLMIERYEMMIDEANERLRRRYGTVVQDTSGPPSKRELVPKYEQKVFFGADKICWPNQKEDPACAAVPYSTLPKNIYGAETDKDPLSYRNRPRYLNSGTIIGRAVDVRAVYDVAIQKVEEGHGVFGDQYVFAEILGEQEYQRETDRKSSQGTGGRWLDWLSGALGTSESPLSGNVTINNSTIQPGRNYEYSVGVDYESRLFQVMTHSAADVKHVTYNDSDQLAQIQDEHESLRSQPFSLPIDIQRADPPYSYAAPGNESEDLGERILLPFSAKLDDIGREPSWYETPLATNMYASNIPVLLHFNGDKALLDTWWPLMWYSPDSRALLRRYVRSGIGRNAARAADAGGLNWWDTRGGRGGVWTDFGTWMSWKDVCRRTEDAVFADGKGAWGREEGDSKLVNSFGLVVIEGDDGEDDENDDRRGGGGAG